MLIVCQFFSGAPKRYGLSVLVSRSSFGARWQNRTRLYARSHGRTAVHRRSVEAGRRGTESAQTLDVIRAGTRTDRLHEYERISTGGFIRRMAYACPKQR